MKPLCRNGFEHQLTFSRTGTAGDDTQLHRVTSPVFSPIVYRKPSLMGSKSRKKDAGYSRAL